jgi:hypothetical protein
MTPNCRGCYSLGNCCGQCDRCHRERIVLGKWPDKQLAELERALRASGPSDGAWMIAAIRARLLRRKLSRDSFHRKVLAW